MTRSCKMPVRVCIFLFLVFGIVDGKSWRGNWGRVKGRGKHNPQSRREFEALHDAEISAQDQQTTPDESIIVEGDIKLPKGMKKASDLNPNKRRNMIRPLGHSKDAISVPAYIWPTTTIPYVIDSSLGDLARDVIRTAVADFNNFTCVRFVQRTSEADYIRFFAGQGCYSMIGRVGGEQDISLGSGCEWKGIAIHEMMHAIGFFHEHTRLDRDDYVKIEFPNIIPAMISNFEKYPTGMGDDLGEPYDYLSVMHYGSKAFARNSNLTTITPIKPNVTAKDIGQRLGFSPIDLRQINKRFQCNNSTPAPPTTVAPVSTSQTPTTVAPVSPSQTPTTVAPVSTSQTPTTVASTASAFVTSGLSTSTTAGGLSSSSSMPGTTSAISLPTSTIVSPASGLVTLPPGLTTESPSSTSDSRLATFGGRGTAEGTTPVAPAPGFTPGPTERPDPARNTGPPKSPCAPYSLYPCWPYDFTYSTQRPPQQCKCAQSSFRVFTVTASCPCQCMPISTGGSSGMGVDDGYLCHAKRRLDPNLFVTRRRASATGKRCASLNNGQFLCMDKATPYHFQLVEGQQASPPGSSCLTLRKPPGRLLLCARTIWKNVL